MTFPSSSVVMLKTLTSKWPLPCIICCAVVVRWKGEREILLFPIWPHCLGNAVQCPPPPSPPRLTLQSVLPALLVENKLLVSQRRAAGLWTQKCVRRGAPTPVVGRFLPTATDEPAEEMEKCSLSLEEEFWTTARCFWKVCAKYFCLIWGQLGWLICTVHMSLEQLWLFTTTLTASCFSKTLIYM